MTAPWGTLADWAAVAASAAAAVAAWKSAEAARISQRAAEEAALRQSRLALMTSAAEVINECRRACETASNLNTAYDTMEGLSGSAENSGINEVKQRNSERIARLNTMSSHAQQYANKVILRNLDIQDLERVQAKLFGSAAEARAIRETIDNKYAETRQANDAVLMARR